MEHIENRAPRKPLSRSVILAVCLLTLLTGALFVTASAIEKRAAAPAATMAANREGTGGSEGTEGQQAAEGSTERESQERGAAPEGPVLGFNLEAPWVLWAVIAETVILVLALIAFGTPVLFLVILLSAAGVALDARELVHQAEASYWLLVVLVSATALSRVAAAVVSTRALILHRRDN